jgi:hypothetical protein
VNDVPGKPIGVRLQTIKHIFGLANLFLMSQIILPA